jgi:hypothetical protein
MKKIFTILLGTVLISCSVNAQSDKEESGTATKAVYGEFGGSGLVFSANFDTRFKGPKGLGFRVGVGYAGGSGASVVTIPLGLNFLTGSGPHHFEMGVSGTLVTDSYSGFDEGSSSWFFHPHFGYRYSKPSNSFNGRIYVGPIIADGFTFFPFGGLSVGYTLPYGKK